jgi:hypothetical protein
MYTPHVTGESTMTTQVVLMNGLGIAVASDSAVTAGSKVLTTSEKIFPLPAPHKGALLTAGLAEFMGIPWEVVFSAWCETLDHQLNSMMEYRDALQKFLQSTVSNLGDLSLAENGYLLRSYYGEDNVYNKILEIYASVVTPFFQNVLSSEEYEKYLQDDWSEEFRDSISKMVTENLVSDFRNQIELVAKERRELYTITPIGLSEAQALIWVQNWWNDLEEDVQKDDFPDFPTIPGLAEMVMYLHSVYIFHPDYNDSLINIIGYGAGDLFPSAAGTFIHGCVRGTLIKRGDAYSSPEDGTRAFFFGQDDAISAIFKGDDWLLSSAATDANQQTLQQIYSQLELSQDEQVLQAKEYVRQSLENDSIRNKMLSEGKEQRRDPFYKAIGMSPILDLAEFSSQLVGVQAAFAAMTQENPSVGGVVDVGIVTHRNGFEWIRQKR